MMRFTRFDSRAAIAMATARYVLPVPAGPIAEDHVVLLDGFQVSALVNTLGLHGALAEGALLACFDKTAQRRRRVGGQDPDHRSEVPINKGDAGTNQVLVIGKDLLGASHIAGRSLYFDGIDLHSNGNVQAIFQQTQVFISCAE